MPAGSSGSIRVDADQYADIRRRARDFSPLLDKELTKALKRGGQIGADAAKAKILTMPSGHGGVVTRTLNAAHPNRVERGLIRTQRKYLRQKLARNIRVVVSNRDVRIVQGVNGISGANAKGLPRRIDEGGRFRHPVFRRDVYANQLGYSYFARPIEARRPEIQAGVEDAMQRALRVLEG